MTIGGWIMMICSVGFVTTLFVGCLVKVLLSGEDPERMHGFEIETPDRKDD